MHDQTHTKTLVTQYGPIGMSSPVSTGILKVRGGGAPSAQSGLAALVAPPSWSGSGRAAPRFPTLCKRCASFRTTNQKLRIRGHQGSQRSQGGQDSQVKGGKVKQGPEREHSDHSADRQKSQSGCFPDRQT